MNKIIVSLSMILGLLLTSLWIAPIISAAGGVKDLRYKEIPKIAFLFLGITFLLTGFSYSFRERNAKVLYLAFIGVVIIFVYFFVLTY